MNAVLPSPQRKRQPAPNRNRAPFERGASKSWSPAPHEHTNAESAAGNQAIQRQLASHGILPKLTMSQPGDADEQEADRVAEAVALNRHVPILAGATGANGARDPHALQRNGHHAAESAAHAAERAANAVGSGGEALPHSVRGEFERYFERDLGEVRVHTSAAAADAARSIHARAYTRGRDIAFAPGEYAPTTHAGRRLLAHELAHVVQQRDSGSASTIHRQLVTPLGAGGGYGGVMDRDRERLAEGPTRPPGTEHSASLGDIVISLPDQELLARKEMKPKIWSWGTGQVTLLAVPIPIPDLPLLAELYGEASANATLTAGVGPLKLTHLQVGTSYGNAFLFAMNPLAALGLGSYKGRAHLELPGDIHGSISISGKLGAAASALSIRIARIEGELVARAGAGTNAMFGGTVELAYTNGVLSFWHAENLVVDVILGFNLDALFRAGILGFEWSKRWGLAEWSRAWRLEWGVNLSYINGVKNLSITTDEEKLPLGTLLGELFSAAGSVLDVVSHTDPHAPPATEDPYARTAGGPSGGNTTEAANTKAGDWLDIHHSRFATGWAGKSAKVTGVYPNAAPPHVLYSGRTPPVGGILGGMGSFQTYGVAWRRQQSIPQEHHIASIYVFDSHPAFGANGISINDPANLMELYGHAGPHDASYHAEVRVELDAAVARGRGIPRDTQLEVVAALGRLRGRVASGSLRLYADPNKNVWPP